MRHAIRSAQGFPPEQQAIRDKCFHPSGSFIEFKKEDLEQSIPARFEEQVRKHPERLAVKTRSQQVTYDELNQLANRMAYHILVERGEAPELVALLLEKDVAAIAAMLGILKAGKSYVPMDPSSSPTQLAYVLEDSQAGVILTNHRHCSLTWELATEAIQVINIDAADDRVSSTANPGGVTSSDSPAYVMYTSGSTSEPKGVLFSHRNLLHRVRQNTNDFHLCKDDRLSQLPTIGVAPFQRDMFSALLNGAGLFPLDLKAEGVASLPTWLNQEEITFFHLSASAFRNMADLLSGAEAFPKVRVIRLGAEMCSQKEVDLYRRYFSEDCIFVNALSGTESGVVRLYYIDKNTRIEDKSIPVGYPTGDAHILLLDEDGHEVGPDQVGEIVIETEHLPLGYWRRPNLTAARFLSNPDDSAKRTYLTGDLGLMRPDGCLLHMGRKDFEVKIRGFRIDIAAVEAALLDAASVKDVVVVPREDHPGDKRLVAYLVPTHQPGPTVSELRRVLVEKLPDYMIPSVFVMLDGLPKTPNGKTDRRSLSQPGATRPQLDADYVPPRGPAEETLAELWREVLRLDRVGIHDDFLDLGGDSLLATRILVRVLERFQIHLPVRALWESPTVADMAIVIVQHLAKQADPETLMGLLAEVEALVKDEERA